jgi:hypothetical protein
MSGKIIANGRGVAVGLALLCLSAASAAQAQVNVTTYHYDNYRTGWNQNETTLTQSNVVEATFGLLQTVTLDDQVDAQPLIVSGLTINGSQHNVVYVATESNSVYALDASSGAVLVKTNLGNPVSYTNLPGQCNNNGPNVGIDSTPVIDLSNGIIYVVAFTWEKNTAVYRVHALSLTTLADTVTPVVVSASATLTNGSVYTFNAGVNRQRPGLLLANNTVYAGFGSFCDIAANLSRGWVLGWQAGTLTPLASNKLNDKRPKSPDNFFLSSVWMSGYGLAANAAGSIYFVTGNSDYSGTTYNHITNIAESAVTMSPDLSTVQSLFTPGNHVGLDQEDGDFGSGGLMLLPPGGGKFPDVGAAVGKDGNLYLLDTDNLHKEFGSYQVGSCWCGPSYYQGSDGVGRIVTSGNSTVGVWKLADKHKPSLSVYKQWGGVANGQFPGFFTSVSSNGTNAGTAVIWAVGRPTNNDPADIDLYAVNPDTGQPLFSEVAGQWPNTGGDSNTVPVVANGLVYVASDQMLTIFGPGGSKTAALPKIRHTDMRVALAMGEHDVYGVVTSIKGSMIVIRTRDGKELRIDATDAMRAFRFAEPSVNHALEARGNYDKSAVLQADIVLHAKDHPVMWPADR